MFLADAESVHTARYVNYFCQSGLYDVSLLTFSKKNKTICKNTYFLSEHDRSVSGGNYYYLLSVLKISRLIKMIEPDYINAHFSYSMGFLAVLALFHSRVNSSLSVVCHGSDVLDCPHRIYSLVNRLVLLRADRVVAVSRLIDYEIKKLGVNEKKILVAQYGVDLPKQIPVKKTIDIISVRNYVPNSRIDDMLESLSRCKDFSSKRIVFIVPLVGEARLSELKMLYPFVTFYGAMQHEEVLSLLDKSKVYISATKSDGTSISLLEAMCRGVYPVVSDIPANRLLIENGQNGDLFTSMDEMNDFIRKALNLNDKEFEKVKYDNYEIVKNYYNYHTQMQKIGRFCFD